MKKYLVIAATLFVSYGATAQVERTTEKKETTTESAPASKADKRNDSDERILQSLNLTDDQKVKIKEIRKDLRATKEKIEQDTQLTDEQKQGKIKELRAEGFKKIQAELNEEQKSKFRELMKDRKAKS